MTYRDDHRRRERLTEGSEYRRPSLGGVVPANESAGPFGGYGPPGYAPSSHTGFHGGEYMIGGLPRQYAGNFPPMGDLVGAGGMILSGIDSGASYPTPGSGRVPYGTSPEPRGRFAGRGPRNYRRSDARIEEDVNERLTWHSEIDAGDIEVTVENGEVTLTGSVDSRFAKRLAEDIAESCSGVIDVRNRLRIEREDSPTDDIARGDREIRRSVAREDPWERSDRAADEAEKKSRRPRGRSGRKKTGRGRRR